MLHNIYKQEKISVQRLAIFGGVRSKRYAMVVEDAVVTVLNVEEPKQFEVSKAEVMLELV